MITRPIRGSCGHSYTATCYFPQPYMRARWEAGLSALPCPACQKDDPRFNGPFIDPRDVPHVSRRPFGSRRR